MYRTGNTEKTIPFHKRVVSIATFLAPLLASLSNAYAQDPLPSLESIAAAIDQNKQKISNVRLRTTQLTVQSTNFSDLPALTGTKPFIVADRVAFINQVLLLVDGDNQFADEVRTQVADDITLVSHQKYWRTAGSEKIVWAIEKDESLGEDGQIVSVHPVTYLKVGISLPLGPLEDLQIKHIQSGPSLSYPDNVRVGYETFHGLKCIRLSWGEKGKDPHWGYHLVCPERDWKIICREVYLENESDTVKVYSGRYVVESLKKVNDSWLPTSFYSEVKKIGFDGKEKISRSKNTLEEIATNVIDGKTVFLPQLSAGMQFMDDSVSKTDGPPKIIGGNLKGIIAELRDGDFSSVEENIGELDSP
jgi:hypothetical protein